MTHQSLRYSQLLVCFEILYARRDRRTDTIIKTNEHLWPLGLVDQWYLLFYCESDCVCVVTGHHDADLVSGAVALRLELWHPLHAFQETFVVHIWGGLVVGVDGVIISQNRCPLSLLNRINLYFNRSYQYKQYIHFIKCILQTLYKPAPCRPLWQVLRQNKSSVCLPAPSPTRASGRRTWDSTGTCWTRWPCPGWISSASPWWFDELLVGSSFVQHPPSHEHLILSLPRVKSR